MPDIDSTLVGFRIEKLFEYSEIDGTTLFRLWTRQTSTIMQYSTGIYAGISTENIVVRQS
jgi:hypothetical protein